jgi:hypothetical protein
MMRGTSQLAFLRKNIRTDASDRLTLHLEISTSPDVIRPDRTNCHEDCSDENVEPVIVLIFPSWIRKAELSVASEEPEGTTVPWLGADADAWKATLPM